MYGGQQLLSVDVSYIVTRRNTSRILDGPPVDIDSTDVYIPYLIEAGTEYFYSGRIRVTNVIGITTVDCPIVQLFLGKVQVCVRCKYIYHNYFLDICMPLISLHT